MAESDQVSTEHLCQWTLFILFLFLIENAIVWQPSASANAGYMFDIKSAGSKDHKNRWAHFCTP